jgi:hypothetical protein
MARVVLGSDEVLGIPPSWAGVLDRLRSYPVYQILDMLGRLGVLLDRADPDRPIVTQEIILAEIFGPKSVPLKRVVQYQDRRRKEGSLVPITLFHRAQLENCAKVALMYLPIEDDRNANSNLKAFGHALLIINSLIEKAIDSKDLELYLVANGLYNAPEDGSQVLARTWDIYLKDRPHLAKLACYRSLGADIRRITGLEPDAFFAVLMGFNAHWMALGVKDLADVGTSIADDSFLTTNLTFSDTEIKSLFSLVSQDATALQERLQQRYTLDAIRPYDNVLLARRPLVRIGDRHYLPSPYLLRQKLTSGLHHLFLDPDAGLSSKERSQFLTYIGYVWEDYVVQFAQRTYGDSHGVVLRYGADLQTNPEEKAADLLIGIDDMLLAIEIKATLFPLEVRAGGDEQLYLSKIQDLLFDAAEQLDATVRAFERGAFRDSGFDPDRVRAIIPMVASYEGTTLNPLLGNRIAETLKQENWLQQDRVRRLQIIDPAELDLWEAGVAEGFPMHRVVEEKALSAKWTALSFRNFWNVYAPDADVRNAYLGNVLREVFVSVSNYFSPKWREGAE